VPTGSSKAVGEARSEDSPPTGPKDSGAEANGPGSIPINVHGERVDLPLPERMTSALQSGEDHCYLFNLTGKCGGSRYGNSKCAKRHDPVDADTLLALRYKVRHIACTRGVVCRLQDCPFGHMCFRQDCYTPAKPTCGIKRTLHRLIPEVDRWVKPVPCPLPPMVWPAEWENVEHKEEVASSVDDDEGPDNQGVALQSDGTQEEKQGQDEEQKEEQKEEQEQVSEVEDLIDLS
jgi:hypothetical protein